MLYSLLDSLFLEFSLSQWVLYSSVRPLTEVICRYWLIADIHAHVILADCSAVYWNNTCFKSCIFMYIVFLHLIFFNLVQNVCVHVKKTNIRNMCVCIYILFLNIDISICLQQSNVIGEVSLILILLSLNLFGNKTVRCLV